MQKFLSLLFSRRALAVVGVLVLALLVWFVGPLVSFDTLRPLASVGSRVVTIALLLMLLVLWLVNWSMSIIGISVLCLAIGFVTPLLALGDVHPFAPLWVRLTLIGFILLMYALYGLYRLWRALRMDEQLLRRFLHPRGEEVPVAGEIKADLRTVNHIVTQAIRQLRQLRVDMPGWRKIFEGKRFLYELPWFMVVGSPGDGSRPGTAGQRKGTVRLAGTGPGRAAADLALRPVQRTAGNRQRGVAVQPPAGSTAAAAAGETDGVCAGRRHCPSGQ